MTPIKALADIFQGFGKSAAQVKASVDDFNDALSVCSETLAAMSGPTYNYDDDKWLSVSTVSGSQPAPEPRPGRLSPEQEALLAAATKIVEDARAVDEEAARRATHSGRRAMRLTGELP